jgi:hypothetical protein
MPVDERSPRSRRLIAGGGTVGEYTLRDAVPPPEPADPDNRIMITGFFAYVLRRDEIGRLRLAPAWPLWALLCSFRCGGC